jgi:uncharacterized protein
VPRHGRTTANWSLSRATPTSHGSTPLAQVHGDCDYLADFTKFLDGQADAVAGTAYLHNATAGSAVHDLYGNPQDQRGRLFIGARRTDFLRERLDPSGPGSPYADQLIGSALAPSKQLLAVATDQANGASSSSS